MLENIRLSFRGIWTHKLRSFLTMLGIIIGIAAIIAIVSTIQGTNEQIKQNLIGSGSNTVEIKIYENDWEFSMDYGAPPEGFYPVDDGTIDEINEMEKVVSASRYVSRNAYNGIYYKNTAMSGGNIMGVDKAYFDTMGYVVKTGRLLTDADYDNYNKVVVVDENFVDIILNGEEPLGATLEINGDSFVIVGVVTLAKKNEPVINTIQDYYTYVGYDTGGKIMMPITDWPICYSYDEPENVVVQVESTDDMTAVGKSVADLLNSHTQPAGDTYKYKAADLLQQATDLQNLSKSTNSMLIWIAAISLLVGGIGVMNIMLVSVTERTGEIGLKKAIGARKSKIMWQFLTEAAVLTSLGGILGVIFGIILAEVISMVAGTPVAISVPASVLAVGFSMMIGIVFGILPSYQAANLNPIDALRHE